MTRVVLSIVIALFLGHCGHSAKRCDQFGKEYFLGPQPLQFWHAKEYCERNNATLIQIRSAAEADCVTKELSLESYQWYWLGVWPVDGSGDEKVASNTFLDQSSVTWFNWDDDQPRNMGLSPYRCATILVMPKTGRWVKSTCDNFPIYPMCERKLRKHE